MGPEKEIYPLSNVTLQPRILLLFFIQRIENCPETCFGQRDANVRALSIRA